MIRNWMALTIIIALTLLFLLFWESAPQRFLDPEPETKPTNQYPTNMLENSTAKRYAEDGTLTSIFIAKETRHYQANPKRKSKRDYTDFSSPELTLLSPDDAPWKITAKTGKANHNGDKIQLWGDVHIRQKSEAGQMSELTTPYLVVRPEQQYAETNKPVIINSAGSETRAVGMKAYLQQDIIQLLSNVRGIHEPQ